MSDFRNEDGLRRECEEARRDGFTGKMAIHPAQVAIINEVFTPSPETIARAQAVIEAFAAQPDAGVDRHRRRDVRPAASAACAAAIAQAGGKALSYFLP